MHQVQQLLEHGQRLRVSASRKPEALEMDTTFQGGKEATGGYDSCHCGIEYDKYTHRPQALPGDEDQSLRVAYPYVIPRPETVGEAAIHDPKQPPTIRVHEGEVRKLGPGARLGSRHLTGHGRGDGGARRRRHCGIYDGRSRIRKQRSGGSHWTVRNRRLEFHGPRLPDLIEVREAEGDEVLTRSNAME